MDFAGYQNMVVDASKAVQFKLVRRRADVHDDSIRFYPEMSHQIFGQNETIFGYEDLNVQVLYTAGPMNINISLSFKHKLDKSSGSIEADDVVGDITKQLPENALIPNFEDFLNTVDESYSFKPFGEKIAEHLTAGAGVSKKLFEIYVCDSRNNEFLEFFQRLETLSLWFIDAASYIDTEDNNWRYFVVHEKFKNFAGNYQYATAGYCIAYEYYAYPDKIRPRISQLLVLPPFQRLGVATKLIETVYAFYKKMPNIRDITVEAPSDDFRRLRNFVDAQHCISLPSFSKAKLKQGFSVEMIKEAQEKAKVNRKQARIVYEILRLYYTDVCNNIEYNHYRKVVKNRLNTSYVQQLKNLEKLEQHSNVDTTLHRAALPSIRDRDDQLQQEYDDIEEEYKHVIYKLKSLG